MWIRPGKERPRLTLTVYVKLVNDELRTLHSQFGFSMARFMTKAGECLEYICAYQYLSPHQNGYDRRKR